MKRVSKAEWLQNALDLLEAEGVEAIRVERLARELGISKSGFYWHFKDRDDLRAQMVEYWAHEFTEVVTENPLLRDEGDPRKRLEKTMLMILDNDLTRYEIAMQGWAAADEGIAKRVQEIYGLRMDFLRELFREMGFLGDELEMRARLWLGYQTSERSVFSGESKKSLRKLIKRRADLLSKK